MKVSECGYYAWLKRVPSARAHKNEYLKTEIKRVHEDSKRRYGSPRITKELKQDGIMVSQPTVVKLMKEQGIKSIIKKKFKVTTDSSHKYPVVENVLDRNFYMEELNHAWVSDLTYIWTAEGWVYLTTVIDLCDRKVIGWALSETMRACDTTVPAFRMAVRNRNINSDHGFIFHSDRGIQYACEEFVSELKKYKNLTRSMSRKGNCWDNAVAESFFKTLKVELIYQNRYEIKTDAMLSIFEYIETWYNRKRRHKHLNNLTIEEFYRLTNNTKNAA
jgi:putative transposase